MSFQPKKTDLASKEAYSDSLAKATQAQANSWARQFSVNEEGEEGGEGKKKKGYQGMEKELAALELAMKQKEEERRHMQASLRKLDAEISTLSKSIDTRKHAVCWGKWQREEEREREREKRVDAKSRRRG
jgi:hypothetical protein